MTTTQNKAVYALLNKTGLITQKENIIAGISNGRTSSSKDLSYDEVVALIRYLKSQDPDEKKAETMRRKIIRMAHEMHWQVTGLEAQRQIGAKPKADMKRIDGWCKQYGYLHKGLDNYTMKELPKLVSQFEIIHKQFLSKI